ncbi:MAG: sulfatase [Gemmatimonadota bacterium]|nr:MAG: sulfatase [Gemmatimonadota bacterium]
MIIRPLCCSIIALAALAQTSPAQDSERPNILWIIAEDIGPELGIYGTPEVRTPNLDRLATQGMLFTQAFTTSPVCSPSRSAFNTGMYQTTIGAHNHRSHRAADPSEYPFPLPDGVRIVSHWLRDAGYFTANIRHFPEGVAFQGTGKTDWNFTVEDEPFDTDRWEDLKARQPFYAQINLPETHRGSDWDAAHERIPQPADPDKVIFPPYYPDHPVVRADWAQYLNAVMSLDVKVGVVLQLLERDGLADNTVVIFMGDNGRAMVRGKQWPYDSGLHVPLIVYWPAALSPPAPYEPAGVSNQLICSIDVAATTLAIGGVAQPPLMQGRVFLGTNSDPPRRYVFGGRDRGDETVDRIRTVRTQRYRYVRNFMPERPFLQINRYKEATYPAIWVLRQLDSEGRLTPTQARLLAPYRPSEELYDVSADPYEIENLASSPSHQEVLDQLRTVLDAWIVESNDQGRIPEDSAVVAYYEQRMKDTYDERIAALRRQWGVPER